MCRVSRVDMKATLIESQSAENVGAVGLLLGMAGRVSCCDVAGREKLEVRGFVDVSKSCSVDVGSNRGNCHPFGRLLRAGVAHVCFS